MQNISQILASSGPGMKALLPSTPGSVVSIRVPVSLPEHKIAEASAEFDSCGEAALTEMAREAVRFVNAMASADHGGYWLSLLGPSGTGKTMVARIISRLFRKYIEGKPDELRNTQAGDMYRRAGGVLEWPRCMDLMLDGDFGFVRQACEDWFLVIDDIGVEHAKLRELSASKLFAILNARQHKFTVLTANLGVQEIAEKLDPRIASRLLRHGGTIVDTTGCQDYGIRKYLEKKGAA